LNNHPLITSPIRIKPFPALARSDSSASPDKKNVTPPSEASSFGTTPATLNSTSATNGTGSLSLLSKSSYFALRPNCQLKLDSSSSGSVDSRWQGFDIDAMVGQLDDISDPAIFNALSNLEGINQPRIYNVDIVYDSDESKSGGSWESSAWESFQKLLGHEIGRSDYLKESFFSKQSGGAGAYDLGMALHYGVKKESSAAAASTSKYAEKETPAMAERRTNIIYEFMDTEESYVKSIKFIEDASALMNWPPSIINHFNHRFI
jgi:hypothetical protein